MRTEEEQRAQLYQVASSHPDEATRAKARELLDALPKHPADTRETDFVDRVEGDKAVLLDRTGAPRNVPAGNLREGQDVRRAPVNYTPSMRDPDEQINVISSPVSTANRVTGAVGSAGSKANHVLDDVPVLRHLPYLIARYGNGLTMGASDAIGDLAGTDSPANRARASEQATVSDIPLGPAAEFAGTMNPRGAASAVANGMENLAAQAVSRSPRVMALLGRAAAVPGAKVVTRAAEGAGLAGGLGAIVGAVNSRGSLSDMANGALEGAKGGAATGAVLGAGSGVASGIASAARSPDIALLEKYGMEPSPVPGRPVANQGESVRQQIAATLTRTPPATGVSKATTATIDKAGIESAKPIVNDLYARQRVNQARMGKLRAQNEENFPEPSVPVGPQQEALQRLENAPGTSRSNRSRSRDLQAQVQKFSRPDPNRTVITPNVSTADLAKAKVAELDATDPFGPGGGEKPKLAPLTPQPAPIRAPIAKDPEFQVTVDNLAKKLATGKGTPNDMAAYEALTLPPEAVSQPAGKTTGAPLGIRPTDLQQIRDHVDSLAKQDARGATKVPKDANEMAQIAKGMQKALPREMQIQDANFSKATGRIEDAKRSLRLGSKPLHPDNTELAIKAGRQLSSAGKGNAASAERIKSLREEGAPAVMRSARSQAPEQIDYGSLIDRPALQAAQQRLQLDPGSLLSEGVVKSVPRGLRAFSQRLVYPAAKITGNAHLGPQSVGFDRLIRALRGRQQDTQE